MEAKQENNQLPMEVYDWLKQQCGAPMDPDRRRTYCGNNLDLPPGYAAHATPYQCLQKGFKTGLCSVYTRARAGAPVAARHNVAKLPIAASIAGILLLAILACAAVLYIARD